MNYEWLKRVFFLQIIFYALIFAFISNRTAEQRDFYIKEQSVLKDKIEELSSPSSGQYNRQFTFLSETLDQQLKYDAKSEEVRLIEKAMSNLRTQQELKVHSELINLENRAKKYKQKELNFLKENQKNLLALLLTSLISLSINFICFVRAQSKPIDKMNRAMREFRKENFTYSIDLDEEGSDRLSHLMRDLNILARKLDLLQKRNEEHRDQLQFDAQQLQESVHSKTKFVRYLGHELRSPLAAIQSFAEMMLEGFHGDVTVKQEESLQRIMNNSQNLLDLVNDLVEQAKAEAGTLALDTEECDLIQFTDALLDSLKVQVDKAKLQLAYSKDVDALQVNINQIRMRQVFTNLLSNAIKFSQEGKVLELKIYQKSNLAYIEFIDEGVGISATDKRKIFMEFHQGDSPHQSKGAGLGLYLSRQIVRLHGGDITVESEEGKGSSFRVQLPLC